MLNIKRLSVLLLLMGTTFIRIEAQKMDKSWQGIALSKDTAWFATTEAIQLA